MEYSKRIERKEVLKLVRSKIVKVLNHVKAPEEQVYPFYKKVWKDIQEGLDYGFEPKYSMFVSDIYTPSISQELKAYHNNSNISDEVVSEVYNFTFEYIKEKLEKYTDVVLVESQNQYGKFFQIKFVN